MEVPSGSYGKRPKCNKCDESMKTVYIRRGQGTLRYTNIGYFCEFCKAVYINDGIKVLPGPVWIGMKKVIS